MKFKIQTDVLRNITGTLSKVVTKDMASGAQGGVKITVSSNSVFFKTQQFDFNTMYSVVGEECSDGSVFVSISILDGIVNSLFDTFVVFELEGKTVTVSTNTSTTSMYILEDVEDIDELDSKSKQDPLLSIKREVLLNGFKSVQHAAAESFIKPEIASVYLYTKDNSIYFVSTDAFRLTEMRFLSENIRGDVGVLIPIKGVAKLIRIFEGISDTDVALYILEDGIFTETESVVVKMNGVSGSFPDYKNIMPTSFSLEIVLLKSDITNFLKRARLFADKLNKMSISIVDEKNVSLAFSNETVGSTTNTLPAAIKGDADALPSFNYKFVSDALSVVNDERVIFSFVNDLTKPLMVRGAEDTTLTSIISPLLDKQE